MDIMYIALYIVACSIEISNIVQCTTHMACWANHDAHTAVMHACARLITQQKLITLRKLRKSLLLK